MDESSRIRAKLAQSLTQQQQILTPSQKSIIKGNLNLYTAGSANYLDGVVSYTGIPFDGDFYLGTGDFTIEWFQNLTAGASFPRAFSLGYFGPGPGSLTCSIAVSEEVNGGGRDIYYWRNSGGAYGGNNGYRFATIPAGYVVGTWVHMALVRKSGVTRMYMNGSQLGSDLADTTNIGNLEPYPNPSTFTGYNILAVGDEIPETASTTFAGYITSFRWTKGTALYWGNFQPPVSALTPVTGTKLLLLNLNPGGLTVDSSGLNKMVVSQNVNSSCSIPYIPSNYYATSPSCVSLTPQTVQTQQVFNT